MQLHTLALQAIGPFDGAHTINFSELGKSGLFLLEGPTGAGKSTIIDAVVFALYGAIAGSDASKQRLHSHHAAPGVEPFVDLIFEVQAGIFRVRRTAAHERPKRSGVGTTSQNEKVTLTRLSSIDAPDHGEALSTRAPEVNGEIRGVIGLDCKQFLQTVVLPQGEFAKFLRARGEERKELLRTIFRTDIYEEMIEQLKAKRIAANRSIEASKKTVGQSLASFGTACQSLLVDDVDQDDPQAMQQSCTEIAATVEAEATAAAKANASAQEALTAATDDRVEQQRVTALLARRDELLIRRTAHNSMAATIEKLRARQQSARRAQGVQLAASGVDNARNRVDEATSGLQEARSGLHEALNAEPPLDQLETLRDAVLTRTTDLASLRSIEVDLPARRIAVEGLTGRCQQLQAHIGVLSQRLASAPDEIAEIEVRHKQLSQDAHQATTASKALDAADKALTAATNALTKSTELDILSRDRDRLIAGGRDAAASVARLRQQRFDQYAGVLSTRLVDGHPCAVCGSTDHPKPATLAGDPLSNDDITAAEEALARADTAAKTAADRASACQHDLIREQERAGGLDVSSATQARSSAQQLVEKAQTAANALDAVDSELRLTLQRRDNDQTQIGKTGVELATLGADVASQTAALTKDEQRIITAIDGNFDSLAALITDLDAQRVAINLAIHARDELRQAEHTHQSRLTEIKTAVDDNGFDSIDSALAAALETGELTSNDTQIAQYDQEAAVIVDGLAQPDVAGLTGEERPDVEAAEAVETRCRQVAGETQKQANVLGARAASTTKCLTALCEAIEQHQRAHAQAASTIRLAGITEGSHAANLRHISLGTYVLMRRFDDVVSAANARYGAMSNGRYRLVRIDEKEGKGGGHRTGLALAVFDADTGKRREPRTLSGGETFNASLCLALGLADVVTGETGGIELGTLFVDEGFGTLDSESLDRVMVELGKLSQNGRIVGIVSHVEDLKQRVADRIEVRRKPSGGSTLTVKAG